MNNDTQIQEVYEYWNKNPLHSIEFPQDQITKEYFDQIDDVRWNENELWSQSTFYNLKGNSNTKILDAGCGIGVFTRYYARKGFNVTAIDLTQKAIELTQLSLKLNNLNAEVKQASVENLPLESNTFDYIVSNGVIHHTPQTEKAVSEFYRILKPGGKATVAVYYRNGLLRFPLWPLVRALLPLLLKKLRGREKFLDVKTPEDFVRVYDGNNTPIAKVYTKKQTKKLFANFRILAMEPHYFPIRFLKGFKRGGWVHSILDNCFGCLIYVLLEKPA